MLDAALALRDAALAVLLGLGGVEYAQAPAPQRPASAPAMAVTIGDEKTGLTLAWHEPDRRDAQRRRFLVVGFEMRAPRLPRLKAP